MEEAEGPELTTRYLTRRILALNIAAIYVGPDVVYSYTYDAELFQFFG